MSRSLFSGPLLVLLWQVAPVQTVPDSSGRIRVSLGYGAGTYHSRAELSSCDGQTLQTSTRGGSWRAEAAEVEAWVTPRVRAAVTAVRNSATPDVPTRWLAGSLVAVEGPSIGAGGGVAYLGGTGAVIAPVVYLRVGQLERRHYRVDLLLPDPPGGGDQWFRLAVGHNQGRHGGSRWLTGVATELGRRNGGLLWTGDFAWPVNRDVEFTLGGRMGLGRLFHEDIGVEGTYTSWRLSAGLRVSLLR